MKCLLNPKPSLPLRKSPNPWDLPKFECYFWKISCFIWFWKSDALHPLTGTHYSKPKRKKIQTLDLVSNLRRASRWKSWKANIRYAHSTAWGQHTDVSIKYCSWEGHAVHSRCLDKQPPSTDAQRRGWLSGAGWAVHLADNGASFSLQHTSHLLKPSTEQCPWHYFSGKCERHKTMSTPLSRAWRTTTFFKHSWSLMLCI